MASSLRAGYHSGSVTWVGLATRSGNAVIVGAKDTDGGVDWLGAWVGGVTAASLGETGATCTAGAGNGGGKGVCTGVGMDTGTGMGMGAGLSSGVGAGVALDGGDGGAVV